MCLNRKVLAGLAALAGAVVLLAPGVVGRVLPVLLVAACPLSMVLMMRGMSGHRAQNSDGPGSSPSDSQASEIARLRAEVARLRTAQREVRALRPEVSDEDSPPPAGDAGARHR